VFQRNPLTRELSGLGSDSGGLFALAGLALVGGIVCLVLREVAVFRPDAAVPVAT